MKAILLAAGVGRRLGHDRPKALLEVGERTLLARHLTNLEALGIPLRIVTGFEAEQIARHAPSAELVHNAEFRRGSLLSLATGLHGLDEDVLVMDADVLYAPSILADVAALERGFALDARTDAGDEEMMLGVRAGRVVAIRRGLRTGEGEGRAFDLLGEGVGFFKLDQAQLPALRAAIDACDPEGDYEAALDRLVGDIGADFVSVGERPWTEIDFHEDVERATRDVLPGIDPVA